MKHTTSPYSRNEEAEDWDPIVGNMASNVCDHGTSYAMATVAASIYFNTKN